MNGSLKLMIFQTFKIGRNNAYPHKKSRNNAHPHKKVETTPIHKKEDPFDKDNYRPISIFFTFDTKSLKKLYTAKFTATCSSS